MSMFYMFLQRGLHPAEVAGEDPAAAHGEEAVPRQHHGHLGEYFYSLCNCMVYVCVSYI